MSAARVRRYNPLLALTDPHYRRFAIGSIVSVLGMWMQRVGVAWLAWELSKSPFWLGVIAAADMLPAIVFSSFAGSLADSYDKVKVLRSAQTVAIMQSITLALLTWLGMTTIELLLGLTLVVGISSSLEQPVRLSLLREIAPPDYLHAAVALNALSFNVARFVGPILAGALISKLNVGVTFAASAAAIAVFSYALAVIRIRKDPREFSGVSSGSGIAAGFRYVLGNRSMLATLGLMAATGISVNGILQILPAVSEALFAKGIDGFVGLMAASALGSVASGTITLLRPPSTRGAFDIAVATLCAAAALAALALTPAFSVALVAIFCMSFANMSAGISGQALLQLQSEPGKLGRVMGLYSMIIRGGPAVGSFLIGTAATFVGMTVPIAAVAVAAACYAAFTAMAFRRP